MINKDKLTVDYFEEKFEEQPPSHVVKVLSCDQIFGTHIIETSTLWYGVDEKGLCVWFIFCPYELNSVVLTIEADKVMDTWLWKVSHWSKYWSEEEYLTTTWID